MKNDTCRRWMGPGTCAAVMIATGVLLVAGCDQGPPPPGGTQPAPKGTTPVAPPAGGNAAGTSGADQAAALASRGNAPNRLDQLAEEPKSLAGRSAKLAKDVADQIGNNQAHAGGLADEIAGGAGAFEVGGVRLMMPEEWEKKPPAGSMRAGEFHVKGAGDEVATVIFFNFPTGQGGDVASNLERWKGQFRNPDTGGEPEHKKHAPRTVSGMKVHSISIVGTYMDGMPGTGQTTERTGYAMRGAFIEGPQGSVVIKMTGPFDVVNSTRDQWYQLIDGMTKK